MQCCDYWRMFQLENFLETCFSLLIDIWFRQWCLAQDWQSWEFLVSTRLLTLIHREIHHQFNFCIFNFFFILPSVIDVWLQIYCVICSHKGAVAIRQPYIRVVGIEETNETNSRGPAAFTQDEVSGETWNNL